MTPERESGRSPGSEPADEDYDFSSLGSEPGSSAGSASPASEAGSDTGATHSDEGTSRRGRPSGPPNMLPARETRRSRLERGTMRIVATAGIVGICVAIAAILADNNTQGWIIGLVVSLISVVLSAVLWSSRQL